MSLLVIQIFLGMLLPVGIMITVRLFSVTAELRKLFYFTAIILIQLGIFATRWNVVIGGQLFSKSFRGLTTYKMEVVGIEGLITALVLLALPFGVLLLLLKVFPPWRKAAA